MSDCISREGIIAKAEEESKGMDEPFCDLLPSLVAWLAEKMPSVEPERKPGKWEWNNRTGEYECSECGCNPTYEGMTPDVSEIDKYKYCRWCGAKMEVTNGHKME